MTNISQELLHVGFCNLVQVLWIICCYMYVKENQISPTYSSLNFFIFLSLQFSNIKKNHLSFLRDWVKLGPHMDSRLYHVYLNQAAGVYLFIYFFNFLCLRFQTLNFCHTFLWGLQSGNLIHMGKGLIYCVHQIQAARIYVFIYFSSFSCLSKIKILHLQNCFNLLLMAMAGGMWALLTLCYI